MIAALEDFKKNLNSYINYSSKWREKSLLFSQLMNAFGSPIWYNMKKTHTLWVDTLSLRFCLNLKMKSISIRVREEIRKGSRERRHLPRGIRIKMRIWGRIVEKKKRKIEVSRDWLGFPIFLPSFPFHYPHNILPPSLLQYSKLYYTTYSPSPFQKLLSLIFFTSEKKTLFFGLNLKFRNFISTYKKSVLFFYNVLRDYII